MIVPTLETFVPLGKEVFLRVPVSHVGRDALISSGLITIWSLAWIRLSSAGDNFH